MTILDLDHQIEHASLGDHICLVYDDFAQQMRAVVPFVKQGLERDEACLYITDDRSAESVKSALRAEGVDVDGQVAQGHLSFATKREAYLEAGGFEPQVMLDFLEQAVERAVEAGRTGLRITGEMTWALGDEPGCERLIEYEALLNRYFPGSKAVAICQYSRERFSPEVIRDVLRTHPIAIVGEQVCPNPFFQPPELVLGAGGADRQVEWMIERLLGLRERELALNEALQVRDEFLSMASHELRTPLQALVLRLGSIRKLSADDDGGASERLTRHLDAAHRQLQHLERLVNGLLDVSRAAQGRLQLVTEDLDLREVVEDVVARRAGGPIEVTAPDPVRGQWDRLRLDQVLDNLISNALKYGAGKPVRVSVTSEEAGAVLRVADQGVGIAEGDLPRLFQRFARAASGRNFSGLGLGLWISRQIVEAHGGTIELESQVGVGTTFTVRLPTSAG